MTPVSIAVIALGPLAFAFLAFAEWKRRRVIIAAFVALALALGVTGIRLAAYLATAPAPVLPKGVPAYLPWLLLALLLSALLFARIPGGRRAAGDSRRKRP
jgi:glucose uptake protein GlcU